MPVEDVVVIAVVEVSVFPVDAVEPEVDVEIDVGKVVEDDDVVDVDVVVVAVDVEVDGIVVVVTTLGTNKKNTRAMENN